MHAQKGLTLIEVLIALAIVSIAMTAIIKAATQNIQSTSYLQKKTIAMWVAEDVINQTRAKLLNIGRSSGNQRLTTEMLGRDWYWHQDEEETPNKQIKKIIVKVYEHEEVNTNPLITLEGYVYHEE
jgi:general secretion pathway protein I